MNENRAGFFAGLAGGFGFYVAWMFLALLWRTSTTEDALMKTVICFILGLAVGTVLYLGVYFVIGKYRGATISKPLTRYPLWGIVAGLAIAFVFGLFLYNPVALWMPIYGVYGLQSVLP
jgi:hypothetical protein